MTPQALHLETDARGVATVTLDRADKHNALDADLIQALTTCAEVLGTDPKVRVVVLTGRGDTFCAGGDLEWMRAQFTASREVRMAEARKLAHMLKAFDAIPKPVIARVQGPAYGGGIGLMSVCDIAVARPSATFALTEVRLGLIPATISPYVAARLGQGAMRHMALSPRAFSAAEAQHMGLVHAICADDGPSALDEAVEREIKAILTASPEAAAAAKRLVRGFAPAIDERAIEHSIRQLADVWETDDAREGVTAFFEKRRPAWRA